VDHEADPDREAKRPSGQGSVASSQPRRRSTAPIEREWLAAKSPYVWLWLSPILTVPTLLITDSFGELLYSLTCGGAWRCNNIIVQRAIRLAAVALSALWHLILLTWARDRRIFVRWHGRQALALAGLRTAVALLAEFLPSPYAALPILIIIWLVGNLWGQAEVRLGECSLMRWTGHAEELEAWRCRCRGHGTGTEVDPDALIDIIRTGSDPAARQLALDQLEELGMVESL
jgi:hypothetical protein